MSRLSRKVHDKRLLKLIGRYLSAGVMIDGQCYPARVGMPQGGPLSPLLSNVLLDVLDKKLEYRGHCFARYCDDFVILVGSQRAGERVMESITCYLERRLKLRISSADPHATWGGESWRETSSYPIYAYTTRVH